MNKKLTMGLIIIGIIVILLIFSLNYKAKINKQEKLLNIMEITSPDFNNNEKIPIKFTGDGENINPNLNIQNIPEDAKSLVLIIDDPDAPARTWVHWVVFNIPAATPRISENSVPGIQGKNSGNADSYDGPMPPSGTHRYFFKIYALDVELELIGGASKQEVESAMENHILDKAELIGLYR